ncbi:hypothetical protein POJ06DRAFT_262628 [Lipomyces tetrasporus]|uniref:Defect at low temperature protein 1 n=1 Tax=Lipomyces tetrasporus TaxID=54092 RepID=A0AAD7QLJ6_9ASCO|nr:uncharacterized protein POJ06DRAFT_262628 [Lipomyces tetrasporus]KAJ8097140.1 hypothetical protein POJ06DRAFT_262628 [Lipomyces tetrasporus]
MKMASHNSLLSDRWARFLYRCSLFLLIFFTCGFVIVTPADLISQALRNEQIYNIIIVAATYFAVGLVALLLYLNRLYDVRVALSDIPKRYVPGNRDFPRRCANAIEAELIRCRLIQESIQPSDSVSHPGLPPPHSEFDFPQVPYLEVLIESVKLLEIKASNLHPALRRKPGMSWKEYTLHLENYVSFDAVLAHQFIDAYEEARYSGRLITEDKFKDMMRTFTLLLRNIELPESVNEVLGEYRYG